MAEDIIPLAPAHPTPSTGAYTRRASADDKLNRLWTLQERLRLAQQIDSNLPYFTHTISVSVVGGPKADMQRIWALCLSTAFGRYRQAGLQGFQAADLDAVWDVTGKACQVQMQYVNSGFIGVALNLAAKGASAVAPSLANNDIANFIITGPTQETVGGKTASWLNADLILGAVAAGGAAGYLAGAFVGGRFLGDARLGGAVGSAAGAIQAYVNAKAAGLALGYNAERQLPDSGRIITTANKVNPNLQPPRPPGDNFSRTFPYIALVANALTDPGYLPAAPPEPTVYNPQPIYVPLSEARGLTNSRLQGQAINLPVGLGTETLAAAFGGLAVASETLRTLATPRADGYPGLPPAAANLRGFQNRLGTTE